MNIEQYTKRKAELQEALKDNAQQMIKQLFAELFEAAPDIKTVAWTQYAPYFNDGEPCTFSVNDPNFFTKFPEDDEDMDLDDSELCTFNWPAQGHVVRPEIQSFQKKFALAEDILETLTEDGRVVVTNRDGEIQIAVDSIDHE